MVTVTADNQPIQDAAVSLFTVEMTDENGVVEIAIPKSIQDTCILPLKVYKTGYVTTLEYIKFIPASHPPYVDLQTSIPVIQKTYSPITPVSYTHLRAHET